MSSTKPVIFISYSHKEEPERARQREAQWHFSLLARGLLG